MKKSEMIRKMCSVWNMYNEGPPMTEDSAGALLKFIEDEGMLPPLSLDKSQIYPLGNKFHNPNYKGSLENIWESEDET